MLLRPGLEGHEPAPRLPQRILLLGMHQIALVEEREAHLQVLPLPVLHRHRHRGFSALRLLPKEDLGHLHGTPGLQKAHPEAARV